MELDNFIRETVKQHQYYLRMNTKILALGLLSLALGASGCSSTCLDMDKISGKIDQWLGEHPEYAYLIFIAVFLLMLVGIILNWKWAWEPRTPSGWELANTLGEKTYRFWKGVFVAILIAILVVIYFTTY